MQTARFGHNAQRAQQPYVPFAPDECALALLDASGKRCYNNVQYEILGFPL
jgi:hypothetical protein